MKFSIVTPSYNQARFINDTIDSVLNQTYKNFEYIVVDGESTDGTKEILAGYEAQLSKIIIESDDGQTDAINKGLSFATGDIFAYLNSDDYYFHDTLEKVSKIFEDNPDIDMVYGDCVFTDEKGQFLRYFSEISDFNEDRLRNFSDHVMQPAAFWRKEVFEKFGPFDKDLHFGFDWAFWCELAKNNCHIKRIPHILAANRVYSQTKTLSGNTERLDELKLINNRYKTRLFTHAYYRYYLSDLVDKNNKTLWDYLLMPWLILLSYGNIIHHYKNFDKKIIFGHIPKTQYVLKEASIKMPCLNYKSIKIHMCAPPSINQSVTMYSSGKKIDKFFFIDGKLEIDSKLGDGTKDVDIDFVFDAEYCRFRNLLGRVLFFYEPQNIAAEITSIVMS